MSHLRSLAYRVTTKKLRKLGFVFRRATGGTHEIWWNETTRKTCVVPHHKEIKAGTLKSILRQAGVTEGTFLEAA